MTSAELRQAYISFFEARGHVNIGSASLVPENDPTTLFTSSGMQPLVPFLLGARHGSGTRLVNSQRCFRSQDIEEVGDNRHTTYFEMMGNWSLGDYFKTEQITWMWEFLTDVVGLDPARLYVTCFSGSDSAGVSRDTESALMWQKLFEGKGISAQIVDNADTAGMQEGRIFYYGEKKNWWSRAGVPLNMPVGEPGGPDTEMFWDFGSGKGFHEASPWAGEPCHVNCDCGRFMEIGNNVFMQYVRTDTGFQELAQKNVDFGGGLERVLAASADTPDVFLLDVFDHARALIESLSGKQYGDTGDDTYAMRVVLDHIRAVVMLTADGVFPSNKDQGYFVRRLLRRAMRYGGKLGLTGAWCGGVAGAVIDTYASVFPHVAEHRATSITEIEKEERKFTQTLEAGVKRFDALATGAVITGKDAFDLLQSYGFPLEMTVELARERGMTVDEAGFQVEKEAHQALSRAGADQKFKGGLADTSDMSVKYHTATHLLHAALRQVLGDHVYQKGSNITPERLRFDFSHPEKMSPEQVAAVEAIVNEQIARALPVTCATMKKDAARDAGAIGVFDDTYGEDVSVYTIGEGDSVFSREFCGGPHVGNTRELGIFKITKEEAVSAGVRRIKAVLEL